LTFFETFFEFTKRPAFRLESHQAALNNSKVILAIFAESCLLREAMQLYRQAYEPDTWFSVRKFGQA